MDTYFIVKYFFTQKYSSSKEMKDIFESQKVLSRDLREKILFFLNNRNAAPQ